jgi:Flp pilus assembly protein TadG
MGMLSQFWNCSIKKPTHRWCDGRRNRRGAVALEFAILAVPFFLWILFIFEMSYDLFTQEALDFAVHAAVRQIQTGSAQSLTSGAAFIGKDICGAAKNLLECNHIWLKLSAITTPDYSPPTANGAVPQNGSTLNLSDYTNLAGAKVGGGGTTAPPTPYCVAGPKQPILVSVVYLGPSFIGGLLPGVLSAQFGDTTVHATLSTAGFVTEPFISTAPGGGVPSC